MSRIHQAQLACALVIAAAVAACAGDSATAPSSESVTGANTGGVNGPAVAASCQPDVEAPSISSSTPNPATLWPPNHKMVPVTVTTLAGDACDPTPRCAISSVSSDEPVNGLGDGDTAPDWEITGASTLLLRAERAGVGDGRVYSIGTTCTDAAGNASIAWTTVTVPHDQGK